MLICSLLFVKMTSCGFFSRIGSLEVYFRARFQNGYLLTFEPKIEAKPSTSRHTKEHEVFFKWLEYYHQVDKNEQWNCLRPAGTEFQLRVWRELFQVPWGSHCSYRDLAVAVGQPQAAQAIGQAVGRNPISLLIPCHRIIRSNRTLGGYQWGLELKTALLEAEARSGSAGFLLNP